MSVTGEGDPCDECIAAALHEVLGVRDRLHAVLWAEVPAVAALDRSISDLFRARRMLVDSGVDQ
ncbi:MAG: hypothetical protein ABSB68_10100 [Acidimicrobiales bacterium]|jgi:hypothetical protein